MWLSLLGRIWPYLLLSVALIGGAWGLHHTGYKAGYAASEANWQQRFAAAERDLAAANEREKRKEADSIALSEKAKADHEKTVASLNLRAADAERRYASLLRNSSAGSRGGAVRQDGGPAGDPDAIAASSELIDRTGRDFSALARRCEGDAATLISLQEWVRGQLAIQRH